MVVKHINYVLPTAVLYSLCCVLYCVKVMWTPAEHRAEVRQLAPGLIQTSVDKQIPQTLHQNGISRLLLRYNQANMQEIRYKHTFSTYNTNLLAPDTYGMLFEAML